MKEYISDKSDKSEYEKVIQSLNFREALIICYEHENSIFRLCTDRVNFDRNDTREFWEFKFYGVFEFVRKEGLNKTMNSITNVYSSKEHTGNLCLTDLFIKCNNEYYCSASIHVDMAFGEICFNFSSKELSMIEASAYFDDKSQDWIYSNIDQNEIIDFYNPFKW